MNSIPKEMIVVFAMIFGLYLLVLLAIISDLVSGVRKAKQRGEAVKVTVPMNMTYQVVFQADDRYKCPERQEYIALAGETREVKGYYYTEVVKVKVSSDDSSSVIGQKVTINGTQYTWSGEKIEVKIPHDVEYSVSVDHKTGYTTPETVTVTASQKLNEIAMRYLLINVNTITIDQTVSDPATMVSGDVNGDIIRWIRSNSHLVLAKKTADGTLTRSTQQNSGKEWITHAKALSESRCLGRATATYYLRIGQTRSRRSSGLNRAHAHRPSSA